MTAKGISMSNRPRLRFYCRGTAQVADPHAQERGTRRMIGRRWQEVLPGTWAWCPTDKPEATDYHPDLVQACREGDLWAADEETAAFCKVPFDPDFGKEPTQSIREFKAQKAGEPSKPAEEPKPDAAKPQKTEQPAKVGGKGD